MGGPEVFVVLAGAAKTQSAGALGGVESIFTSEKCLCDSAFDKNEWRGSDEREVVSYCYVVDKIYENHGDIPAAPFVILQLHRDVYCPRGRFPR